MASAMIASLALHVLLIAAPAKKQTEHIAQRAQNVWEGTAFITNAVPVLLIAATRIAKGAKPVLPVLLTAAPARLKNQMVIFATGLPNAKEDIVSTITAVHLLFIAAILSVTAAKVILPVLWIV
jgi:hypothetical protein